MLQARIFAAPSGSVLDLTGCTYTTGATVDRPLTIRGATIRPPAGSAGLVVKASGVTLDRLTITGPQGRTFNDTDYGVYASGGISSLTVSRSSIGNFGFGGIYVNGVSGVSISGNTVHDCVYAGIMVLSGQGGRVTGNTVQRIGVYGSSANQGNAYGITLSALSGSPMTTNVVVSGNTIADVPTWHGFDTHGGQHITFSNNKVSGSLRAVFITNGGQRATDVSITGNVLVAPSNPTANDFAVTTYDTVNVSVTGNTANGWPAGQAFEDYKNASTGLAVHDNLPAAAWPTIP